MTSYIRTAYQISIDYISSLTPAIVIEDNVLQ